MKTPCKILLLICSLLLVIGLGYGLTHPDLYSHSLWVYRGISITLIIFALVAWFCSQSLIASRPINKTDIGDTIHQWTDKWNLWLSKRPKMINAILIISSFGIDGMAIFLLSWSVMGPSFRPFLALMILFAFRQISQGLCALPPPPRALWRNPGFPSLVVTYDVGNDFFFSGHTSIAVLGAIELFQISPVWGILGSFIAIAEIFVVLILRAHYTMDIIAALGMSWLAYTFSILLASWIGM